MITKEQINNQLNSNYNFSNVMNLLTFNMEGFVFSDMTNEISEKEYFNIWLKYCRIIYNRCENIEIRYIKPFNHYDVIDYELYIDDKFIDSNRCSSMDTAEVQAYIRMGQKGDFEHIIREEFSKVSDVYNLYSRSDIEHIIKSGYNTVWFNLFRISKNKKLMRKIKIRKMIEHE